MHATRYRIVTSVVAALAAATALPLDANAAHGVELIERQTSGLAGAPTDLWLQARVDDAGASNAPLGEVAFRVDRRQLDASAVDGLASAPAGTRLGFATAGPPNDPHHVAMTKTGVLVDPATREPVLTAEIAVPRDLAAVLGPSVPLTMRMTATQLVITVDLEQPARLPAAPGEPRFGLVSMDLFGRYAGGRTLARNPVRATTMTSSVTVRPCADPACSRLGASASDDLAVTLPRPVTLIAPRRATYGVRARFHGSGSPGDRIELAYKLEPGATYHQHVGPPRAYLPLAPPPPPPHRTGPTLGDPLTGGTPANFGRYPLLAPIYPSVVIRSEPQRPAITTVGSDGRWALAVALRTRFPGLSLPYPATGRYAAAAYRDPIGGAPGGEFTIVQDAGRRTVVTLAEPRLRLIRQGSRLHVAVAVRGGDEQVTVTLRARGHVLAVRRLGRTGRASIGVELPRGTVAITATATVDGARSAHSSTLVRSRT